MLLEILEESTKIIKIEKTKKWSGENEVTVNVEKIQKFFKDKFYQRFITPTFFPMLHKPIDWDLEKRGGHFYNAGLIPGEDSAFLTVFNYDLVKQNENITLDFSESPEGAKEVLFVIK